MKSIEQHLFYFLSELSSLRDYVSFSEKQLEEELKRYEASLKAPNDKDDDRYNYRRNFWNDFANEFPQHHRKATSLLVFSIFEDDLNHLCLCFEKHKNLKLSLPDVSESGIDRAKLYLSKVVGLDFPSENYWQKIKSVKKVRNILAHTSGYIEPDRHEEIYRIAKSDSNLGIESYARDRLVIKKPEYILDFITALEGFYKELEQEIKSKGFI